MTVGDIVTLSVALAGLAVGVVAALVSRRHDREQQARPLLLDPATTFARATLAALAAMRYVTPPWPPSEPKGPHRNEAMLADVLAREQRMEVCRKALDDVRSARAAVRLVFHPESLAAGWAWSVLVYLRAALEGAEGFYRDHDDAKLRGEDDRWREGAGRSIRDTYKRDRLRVYQSLDQFYVDVAKRLIRPSWDPKKYNQRQPSMRLNEESNGATGQPDAGLFQSTS
jgi:hypothetical protein